MKRSKSLINSSYDGNQCMDIERCQDELLKSRKRYNKLNQKYLELKVEYNKLEKDYRYNVRIMESIIKESNIAALSEFLEDPKFNNNTNTTNEKEKENNNEIIKENSLSKTTIKILKEKSIYERLKLEIMNLRDELKTKEDTIDDLKNSAKATKFRELDNKFALMYQELNTVKARNQVLETMQADYVNSKNQIIFLLKQIDLYKKDNKKLKELYEKILFDYQNITKQKEDMENSKNLYEDRIKALINKNNSLKIKLEDLRIKNMAYYEELEKYKNLNQNNIDKLLLRKEKEISQYRGQITQLKMEIGTLQKRADERMKNNINSATMTGFKKIKPIYPNKKDNIKELRKTDSDFFVTKPKGVFGGDKKIVINSKIMKKNNDENKFDKKISKIKIKDNKEDTSSMKVENKQENSDILNNYDKKIPTIKGGKNMNDKKTTANEEDINIEYKKEDTIDKDEKLQKEEKEEKEEIINENNISKELNEDSKKYENNNNEKSIKSQNEERELENEEEKEINSYKENDNNKKIDADKDKSQENENIINNNEKSEDNKNENISNEVIKGKYNEEEILVNMSNDKSDKINKDKKNESSYGYNDFESNFDKQNTLKENNNTNINNNLESELKNNTNDINVQSIEQKNDSKEKNNLEENIDNKLKESNVLDNEQKNESRDNNNLSKENNIGKIEEEKKEDNAGDEEEYKFSKNDGLADENI